MALSASLDQRGPAPLDVVLVALVVLVSGSLYYTTYFQNAWLLLVIAIAGARHLYRPGLLSLTAVLFSALFVLVTGLNPSLALSSYVVMLFRAACALLIVSAIPMRTFSHMFLQIVTVLAAVSLLYLPATMLGLQSPLPMFLSLDFIPIQNFILFSLNPMHMANFRNCGLFWEPGAFQFFINLAFLLGIAYKQLRWGHALVLGIALLSTQSTTGYIVFTLILLGYGFTSALNAKLKGLGLALTIGSLPIAFPVLNRVVFSKFSSDNSSFVSFMSRNQDFLLDWQIFQKHWLTGVGYGNLQIRDVYGPKFLGDSYYQFLPTGADSLLIYVSQVGFIGIMILIPLVFPRFLSGFNLFARFLFAIAIIILFNTESMFPFLIANVLLLYGLIENRSQGEEKS